MPTWFQSILGTRGYHRVTATCLHWYSRMCVLLPKGKPCLPPPAAQATVHGRAAAAARRLFETEILGSQSRTSDCMPKSSVGSLQRALVEPPSLEWVETPQTRERTLHLSPFSTHLPLALQLGADLLSTENQGDVSCQEPMGTGGSWLSTNNNIRKTCKLCGLLSF